MAHLLTFILMAHLLIFLSSNSVAIVAAKLINNSEVDRHALLNFKEGITNDPLGALGSWHGDSLDFCNWRGVNCSETLPLRVVSLELNSLRLAGELSFSLANLTSLARLDLGNNQFFGGVPEELGTLPKLQILMLGYNTLGGGIPYSLATSLSLTVLNLTCNNFSGLIPASLFNSSSKLVVIDLQRNLFMGPIPDLHKFVTLQILNLAENDLSGSIPTSLGNVSSLTEIWLDTNMLVGSIPETLSRIRNLSMLSLGANNLSGSVPNLLCNISSLIFLSLDLNNLVGTIPSTMGSSLPNLEVLSMSYNRFEGPIPASLANSSKLLAIDLSHNSLAGTVTSLGSLSDLHTLDLGSNHLECDVWTFLTSLRNCTQLQIVEMDGSTVNGSLPRSVGNLSRSLQLINLGNNQIFGTIPVEIGNLQNLQMLSLRQNLLTGEIPSTIEKLSRLSLLILSSNILTGKILPTIGNLSLLVQLDLGHNKLSGNIPASLGNCKQLAMLNLSGNSLYGSIPTQLLGNTSLSLGLDLSYNKLTGPIPPQIGVLINLIHLDVSFNNLSGEALSSLGQCVTLQYLNTKRNMLNGSIPQSFSNLKSIIQIDLSQNNFAGQIPEFIANFTMLIQLDLSNNYFEGPIPTGGVFQNTTATNVDGNIGLCANATTFASEFPICPRILPGGTNKNGRLLLIVIPPITIALFSFICFMVTLLKKRANTTPCYKETMKKVSYGDILKATNWFSPINKISSSRTGSIYIGRFEFDTDLVAIKLFHLDEHGSLNSFLTECEVLKNTRHRNLMKAVTICSTVDLENNEFKAIVFEFMANGSLDMWVHPKLYQTTPKRGLSLGQRIRIAMEVASALDYMHNQLTPPLVHCDLKPANVLLDYDMTARVGDFGSAKFLSSGLGSPKGLAGMGGTIGYIAPEYGMGHKISTGCDVYSFGVLLLEMLTGMRPTDAIFNDGMSLHKFVSSSYPNRLCEVLDPHMPQHGHHACATVTVQSFLMPLVEIALLCSMESSKDRPGMRDVCAKIFAINEACLESW